MAWVSEAELKPGTTYKRSVQRNTGEWLMGCRGEGGGGERGGGDIDRGQVGGVLGSEAGYSQAAPVAFWRQIIGCGPGTKHTCSLATALSARSKSATSTGHNTSFESPNTSGFMLTV